MQEVCYSYLRDRQVPYGRVKRYRIGGNFRMVQVFTLFTVCWSMWK